jgi:hypothetical protein
MERIEDINQKLIDHYGLDTSTGRPMFRVVWANDELEKRLMDYTDNGVQLLFPVVREVKKYPYLVDMYVLERLVVVPEINQKELPTQKLSYEPIWTFCDVNRNPLPPRWDASKLVVDVLYAALGKKSLRKYVEPDEDEARIDRLQEELFGNESEVTDALAYKEGVVVPGNFKKEN